MSQRLAMPSMSSVLVVGIAAFAAVAGFQLGGGEIPVISALSNEMFYAMAAALIGLGSLSILLRYPDAIGRNAPTIYVLVAILPLLRFGIPGISVIRFLPLTLIAPVVYGLYRNSEPIPSHSRVARIAVFAAFSTAASSLIANRAGTDIMRLFLMIGGIVLLVGAAPRAWSTIWRPAVERSISVTYWLIVASTVVVAPIDGSILDDRLRGLFFSANTVGALLALTTPITAARSRVPLLCWTFAFMLTIASGSRGGLLALSAALIVVLLYHRRIFQLGTIVLVGLFVLSSGVVRIQTDNALGINTRELIWGEVFEAVGDRPVAGYGFGSFDDFEFSAETQGYVAVDAQSHSSWMDALYEQGALGLLPWLLALSVGLLAAFRAGAVWLATLMAGLASATFESWMFAIGGGTGSLFWLVFGAAAVGASRTGLDDRFFVTPVEPEGLDLPEVARGPTREASGVFG